MIKRNKKKEKEKDDDDDDKYFTLLDHPRLRMMRDKE